MSVQVAREVLLDDPLAPGIPAVVRSGSFLFLSSVDGDRDHDTGAVDQSVFGDGPAQAARAYGALVDRLGACGFDGSAAVRIEHATASQDWRLQRMALWPQYFGVPTQAVSQGYQGRMRGRNMITVAAVATTGVVPRAVITPGPDDGRASRISRCGPFLFVIGVRGKESLATGEIAREEVPGAFDDHTRLSLDNIAHHLGNGGGALPDVVRFDAFVRAGAQVAEFERLTTERYGGELDVACSVVACPLGGGTDLELSAIATAPGEPRWSRVTPHGVVTRAGGLVFTTMARGDRGDDGRLERSRCGDLTAQFDAALVRLRHQVEVGGSTMSSLVRLDVYAPDPYRFAELDELVVDRFGIDAPTVVRHGVDLGPTGMVALTAIGAAVTEPA